MKLKHLALLVVAGMLHEHAALAEDMSTLNLSGSLRGGYWSSSMNLDHRNDLAGGALWLKAEPKLGDNVSATFEGWARNEDVFHGGGRHGLVREAYLSTGMGNADFRIGKQIMAWGRADKLNPTDNLTPRDYTLLTPEDDDQRRGLLAAKATYNFNAWSLTGIWLPKAGQNILPLPHQPGSNFSEHSSGGSGGALKVEQSGRDVDWSLSYFDGADANPDLSFGSLGVNGFNLNLDHHRIRVIGADAATVLGKYGLRGELAYTRTEDTAGNNPFIKNPFVYLVAGGDRTFFDYLNVNLQYYARKVMSYQDPAAEPNPLLRHIAVQEALLSNQLDRFQHGLTFRISDKWMNETLEGEIAGIVSFSYREYVLKPRLVYAFNDLWKGTLGANLFRGNSNTFYGSLRDNSNAFVELRYGF